MSNLLMQLTVQVIISYKFKLLALLMQMLLYTLKYVDYPTNLGGQQPCFKFMNI